MYTAGPDVLNIINSYKKEFESHSLYRSMTLEGCSEVVAFMEINMPIYEQIIGDIDDYMFLDIIVEYRDYIDLFKKHIKRLEAEDFVGIPQELFNECEMIIKEINDRLFSELHVLATPFRFLFMSPLYFPPFNIWNYHQFCLNTV